MNYWKATTKNGNKCSESNTVWSDVKDNIGELSFIIEDNQQTITLPKGYEYVQAKSASADLSGGNAVIESRYIGLKLGNNIVKVRVNEKTNNISIEVE